MRISFDTNVLASALAFPNGLCSRLLEECFDNHKVEISEYVLEELADVLVRKLYRSRHEVDGWIAELREHARILPAVEPIPVVLRDPDDLPILSAAVRFESDLLVSDDKDLLDLIDPPIPILKPRALYDLLTANE